MGGKSTTTTNVSQPNPQIMADYQNVVNQANRVANTPLRQYTGPMVAGFNSQQLAAMNESSNVYGMESPYISSASQMGSAGLNGMGNYYGAAGTQLGQGIQGMGNYYNSASNLDQAGINGMSNYYNSATAQGTAGLQGLGQYQNMAGIYGNASTGQINPEQFSAGTLNQYMSPYNQDVINTTLANMNQDNGIQASQLLGQGISAGNAFGGDRTGVAEAQLGKNQALAANATIAGLENANYAQGLNEFNTQQQVGVQAQEYQKQMQAQNAGLLAGMGAEYNTAREQLAGLQSQQGTNYNNALANFGALQSQQGTNLNAAYANAAGLNANMGSNYNNAFANYANLQAALGQQNQQAYMNQIGLQSTFGNQQQALNQAQLNVPYEQYVQAQAYPFQTTQYLANITEGIGGQSGGSSASTAPGPSPVSQVAGLGLTGLGIAGMFGAFSDKNAKTDKQPVDAEAAADKIKDMPVDTWRYKPEVGLGGDHHIGTYAQDFAKNFSGDGHTINLMDAVGANMAAVKGLAQKVDRLERGRSTGGVATSPQDIRAQFGFDQGGAVPGSMGGVPQINSWVPTDASPMMGSHSSIPNAPDVPQQAPGAGGLMQVPNQLMQTEQMISAAHGDPQLRRLAMLGLIGNGLNGFTGGRAEGGRTYDDGGPISALALPGMDYGDSDPHVLNAYGVAPGAYPQIPNIVPQVDRSGTHSANTIPVAPSPGMGAAGGDAGVASGSPLPAGDATWGKADMNNPGASPWFAVAEAGANMMGGSSPFAGVNIGRGLAAGLGAAAEMPRYKYGTELAQAEAGTKELQLKQQQRTFDMMTAAMQKEGVLDSSGKPTGNLPNFNQTSDSGGTSGSSNAASGQPNLDQILETDKSGLLDEYRRDMAQSNYWRQMATMQYPGADKMAQMYADMAVKSPGYLQLVEQIHNHTVPNASGTAVTNLPGSLQSASAQSQASAEGTIRGGYQTITPEPKVSPGGNLPPIAGQNTITTQDAQGTPGLTRVTTQPPKLTGGTPRPSDGEQNLAAAEEDFNGIPKGLLAWQQGQESPGIKDSATSPAGAKGRAQLMDENARKYGIDPRDPGAATSVEGHMMHDYLVQFHGDIDRALIAYNATPQLAASWNGDPSTLPAETQGYLASAHKAGFSGIAQGYGADNGAAAPQGAPAPGITPAPAPQVTAEPLNIQTGPAPAQLARQGDYTKQMTTWGQAMPATQLAEQRLNALADVMKHVKTGAWSTEAAQFAATMDKLGLPVDPNKFADPAQVERMVHDNMLLTMNALKSGVEGAGGNFTQGEWEGLGAALANANMQPGANRTVISQLLGALKYTQDAYQGAHATIDNPKYTGDRDPANYLLNFGKAHPLQSYVDKALHGMGPFAGEKPVQGDFVMGKGGKKYEFLGGDPGKQANYKEVQ